MKKLLTLIFALIAMASTTFAEPDYLCFEVEAGTTISLKKHQWSRRSIQYSFDKKNWIDFVTEFTTGSACRVYFKGKNPQGLSYRKDYYSGDEYHYVTFVVSKPFKCSGNIMTLIDEEGKTKTIPCSSCFYMLFENCPLTTAPKLPATELALECYAGMFSGCNLLTTAPQLPSTHIYALCYSGMFMGCSSLTNPPELQATKVSTSCYASMFAGCTSLTHAPELPATTLEHYCYAGMFDGCSNLESIICNFDSWTEKSTDFWVRNVSETGIFVCPSNLGKAVSDNKIPKGWNIVPIEKTKDVFSISTSDSNVTVDKITAKYNDVINFTVKDRENEGFRLETVYVNDTEVAVDNFKGSFRMALFLKNVKIKAVYTQIKDFKYTISTDEFSNVSISKATFGQEITVTFTKRAGYNLTSATYNGQKMTITDYKSKFTMPAENVEINAVYTPIEYKVSRYQHDISFTNIRLDKTKATIDDVVTFSIKDLTNEGKKIEKVWINDKEIEISDNVGSFEMKDYLQDVIIKISYTYITYSIITDDYTQTNSSKALILHDINFSVTDRSSEGYKLDKVLINDRIVSVKDYKGTFSVKNYVKGNNQDIIITTYYSKINYTITTDEYSRVGTNVANVDDIINISFTKREGYNLSSATYNGNPLNINNYQAAFAMPAHNVEIKTIYNDGQGYTITTDKYSQVPNATATEDDAISITFKQRDGYNLTSATYNGKALTINNYKSSFTMPAQDVVIESIYTPIEYTIACADKNVSVNKTKATIADKVTFTIVDRTAEGYKLDKVTINGKAISLSGYKGSFAMKDYLANVTIKAVYSQNTSTDDSRSISTDEYSQTDKTKCNVGDVVNVTFIKRDGYNLTSATYNGKALTITDYSASFTMPAEDVVIKTVYIPIGNSQFNPLCFEVKAGTKVSLKKYGKANPNIQYSYDKKTWTNFTELTASNDCCIYFKGINPDGFSISYDDYSSFEVSKEFKCSGNIMSLINDVGETTAIPSSYCFFRLFKDCPLTTAPELPATTLANSCYCGMFSKCTSLTTAPELPATTSAQSCYGGMFSNCTSLTTAPELPATTSAQSCYSYMFDGCTSLTTAPKLPATTLAYSCYDHMFYGCTSLTTAPELPATTLAENCYFRMFFGCTRLTTAPELPATTLAENCYFEMFKGCRKIQSIAVNFKSWSENGFERWVENVSAKGVFICPSDLTQQFGINYIPKGWVVHPQSKSFAISSKTEFVTIDKTSAKYNDKVNFSIVDRTSDGYKLDKVLVNNKEVAVSNYAGSFDMMDYLTDVTITAQYSKIPYTITTDEYSQVANTSANVDDAITVTFKQREGYDLTSATYNGNPLNINGYKATFTMPAQDVEIKAVYDDINPNTPVTEIKLENCNVSVFPNPAKSGEKITLKVGGKFDTNNTNIYIYNASGSLVMQIDNVKEYNQLTLLSGVYVGVLVTKGGKKTFRVAVK